MNTLYRDIYSGFHFSLNTCSCFVALADTEHSWKGRSRFPGDWGMPPRDYGKGSSFCRCGPAQLVPTRRPGFPRMLCVAAGAGAAGSKPTRPLQTWGRGTVRCQGEASGCRAGDHSWNGPRGRQDKHPLRCWAASPGSWPLVAGSKARPPR